MTLDISDVITLLFGILGLFAGAFAWVTRGRFHSIRSDSEHGARIDAHRREIDDLGKRLDELFDDFSRRLDAVTGAHELTIRLDERIKKLEEALREQPRTLALCVGEAVKAALRVAPARLA